jgi:putative membrane protein
VLARIITALAVLALLAGCGGGSGDNKNDTSSGASGTNPKAPPLKPSTAPAPPGDAGFLTVDYERAAYEVLAAGIARSRASSATVKSFAARMLRDRARIAGEDTLAAREAKLKIVRRQLTAAERDQLRKLVPLTGKGFDAAYLALERSGIAGDASRTEAAARSAKSSKVRSAAAKHLALYRAELRAADSAAP